MNYYPVKDMTVVKCGCGEPMRRHEWLGHHVACRVASSVPVSEQDVKDLEAHEARVREEF